MGSKRSAKRPSSTAKKVAEKESNEKTKLAEPETTTTSPAISENQASESYSENSPALLLQPPEDPAAPTPKMSKRALKRMRGWEPVIKPPKDLADLPPPSAVPTADVIWLDNSRSVTLIPNSSSGVHTRRGAANLAAVSPPASYLVYTRDPLIKMARAGSKSVHVMTSIPPGGDPRSILSSVPSVSSLTQRSGETATRGPNVASSSSSSSSCLSKPQEETKDESGSEGGGETAAGEEEEVEEADDADASSHSVKSKNEVNMSTSWVENHSSEASASKREKNEALKMSGDVMLNVAMPHTRLGGLSAPQAMLPPPYRRNRRLRRKLHITDETPVFFMHSELRDTMPQLFPKAPFSTEEDVLRSMLDWHEDLTLVYTRLLWELAPDEFLKRVLQQQQQQQQQQGDGCSTKAKTSENL
ncbi:hypothetical protein TraAM80_00415 [Trypanosoma rangeli]|uniref:Uncharacterized protein n=1 Tax=Trypanosoma rangeli TaxID=5698 RepID=A0A422P3F6_TRYRA|nr:uncharacterized protein TraAM80_00415 [Trypanosoma rangeli]RNF12267.1 hypothetical protein TraAM80_00415 [Trypanosoma rangeli]|eukprot:RNF12267.1 hypothetical protein TraAM80_00415 [Trypanosoma rangeli]